MKSACLFACVAVALCAISLWAGPARSDGPASAPPTGASRDARTALGRTIFFDSTLSEPAGTSCASCHEAARAFSGDHGSGVGVAAGSRPGVFARRSTPSLLYLAFIPRFRFFSDDDDRHNADAEPYGGFFWDGRSDSIADLVQQPLLNPREMNNRDLDQIAEKVRRAPYASALAAEFPGALDDTKKAVAALGVALEAYLTSPPMAPFSSRYDDYIRGAGTLTAEEARGLALFKDPKRGGCAVCHKLVDTSPSPEQSMFTDFGFDAVGAPRNTKLRVHDEDRGLCERTDNVNPSNATQWCVSFRTPSLRNVALRKSFMHNGAFTRLRDVISFYATRATNPARWYPSATPFDDTPPAYRGLINTTFVPYDRHPGAPPAFDESEIDALVAFLGTLTDRKLPDAGRSNP
ncbi:MAG TPA: cytochrome c peroxidase [Polyangiaceae bacterium]|jgi:cytochrome c peroxidase|nr:cytochrome c peroxidase [Polyangiaceae bacterium]